MTVKRCEILYDQFNKTYFMAEVFYKNKIPYEWNRVFLQGDNLRQLSQIIEDCFKIYINTKQIKRINKRGHIIKRGKLCLND